MFEIRIHGRGGQGVVSAAEMISVAAFFEDRHAQAFPSFGSERMGAPVMAFCRIADRTIRLREPVVSPDALIIQDPTLLHQVPLFSGLGKEGFILVNSKRSFAELGLAEFVADFRPDHCLTVPASELALEYAGRPLPNAALLGGFCAATGLLKLESVLRAIEEKFPGPVGERNAKAAQAAYDFVRVQKEVPLVSAN